MSVLQSFKLQGQTTADVAIDTVSVTIDSDGFLRWTDDGSIKRSVQITGDLAKLLKELLTGTNGLTHAVLI